MTPWIACLSLLILPIGFLSAQEADGRDLSPHFEPSYVVFGPWSPHHPDTTLFFEASIAPPFYIGLSKRFAVVLTPKVVLRQFAEGSWPVKTPSYMPRVTVYWWWPRTQDVEYVSVMFSHHSNGQGGPHRDPISDALNHENGNFSTNFVELTYLRSLYLADISPVVRGTVEIHVPGTYDADEMRDYSKVRLYGAATAGFSMTEARRKEWSAGAMVGFLAGSVSRRFEGTGRWLGWLTLGWAPSSRSDLSLFLNYYNGQDYYNNYYGQRLSVFRVGLATNRERARSEVPQPPLVP